MGGSDSEASAKRKEVPRVFTVAIRLGGRSAHFCFAKRNGTVEVRRKMRALESPVLNQANASYHPF